MEQTMSDKQEIVDLEKKFWDTMVDKDAKTATAMMAQQSIVIGPQGVAAIKRGDFAKMMRESKWTLDTYRLSDIEVLFPNNDTAVIGYKVKQKGTMDGKPYDMECADSTTWARLDGKWLCSVHTETMMGEPLGDGKKKAA
jgi:ketosteroid isomerase-like protein